MSIHAEGSFTARDVRRGSWVVCRKTMIFMVACGLFILSVAIFLSFASEEGWKGQILLFPLAIFPPVYLCLVLSIKASRQVRRSPNLRSPVSYEFNDEGFTMTAAHSKSQIEWAALAKWKEGKHCLVIYTNTNVGNIVPKRFFQSPADVDTVRQLLRAATK